jgi:hypothetical protein
MNPIYSGETLLTRVAEWQRAGQPVRVLPPFVPAASVEAAQADHLSAMAVARTLGCEQEFDAEIEAEIRGGREPNSGRRRRDPHERLIDVHRIDARLAEPMPLDDVQADDVVIVATSDTGKLLRLPIRAEADAIVLTVVHFDENCVDIVGWIDLADSRRAELLHRANLYLSLQEMDRDAFARLKASRPAPRAGIEAQGVEWMSAAMASFHLGEREGAYDGCSAIERALAICCHYWTVFYRTHDVPEDEVSGLVKLRLDELRPLLEEVAYQ